MKDKWNWIIAIAAIAIVIELGIAISRPSVCGYTFEVIQGKNFNQPYPIWHGQCKQ